jgi:iron complex outermembrane receptor protein
MKHLPNAIRFALLAGASAAVVGGNAFAQDQAKTLDRVEVTGSRIKRVDTETTSPVTLITRADIERTGLTSVRDILNRITASDGNGLSTVSTQTNGNDGTERISLRNLGQARTLVLVDGKRWAVDFAGGTDLTTIPQGIVERIEVLKDGASAIYGSDAIAGVINIITRRNFEGAQFRATYGETEEGDGARESYDLTFGASNERSNLVMSVGFVGRDGITQADRLITRTPVFGCQDPFVASNPGNCGSSFPERGRFFTGLQDGSFGSVALRPGAAGTSVADFKPWDNGDRFNFSPVNFLQLPGDQQNLFASATHDITDNVRATASFSYTKRTSDNRIAEVPLSLDASDNPALADIFGGAQGVFGSGPQWSIPISGQNVFNPFGTDIFSAGFRMIAAGGRFNRADVDTSSTRLGLEGVFNLGDRAFNWDIGGQYNDSQNDERQENLVNLFNLRNALGASFRDGDGVLRCGTPGAVITGCTPFNVFGGADLGVANGVISAEEQARMLAFVTHTAQNQSGTTTNNYYANLSGDLFSLPGGMAQFAAGYEYRKDASFNQPDSLVSGGGSSTNFTEPTKGQTIIEEFYGELSLPLLADTILAKELNVTIAARVTDFESAGNGGEGFVSNDLGSNTNWSVGLRWKPIDDLLVRATWGETFRAPRSIDLFQGGSEGFPDAVDPCSDGAFQDLSATAQARCIAQGVPDGGWQQVSTQQRTLFGGNANLTPETGENINIGLVYNPSWLPGLDLTVDYWRIRLSDAIVGFDAETIVTDCITGGPDGLGLDSLCDFITRGPNGAITDLRAVNFNAAALKTDGIDFSLRYRIDTSLGLFSFNSETTWVSRDRSKLSTDEDFDDAVGESRAGNSSFEYRSNFITSWSKGDFEASWTLRYTSDVLENCVNTPNQRLICNDPGRITDDQPNGTNHIGAVTYHDVAVGWSAPWKGHISAGVNNLFSKEPPLSARTFAGSFLGGVHDLPNSQFWYVQYRQDF